MEIFEELNDIYNEPPQPDAKEAALDRLLTNMNDAQASRRRFIRGGKTPGKLTINPATYRCGTGVGMNMAYG